MEKKLELFLKLAGLSLNQEVDKVKRQINHFSKQPKNQQNFRILQRLNLVLQDLEKEQQKLKLDLEIADLELAKTDGIKEDEEFVLSLIHQVSSGEMEISKAKEQAKKHKIILSEFDYLLNDLSVQQEAGARLLIQ